MKTSSTSITSSSARLLLLNIDTSYCDDGVATLSQERRFQVYLLLSLPSLNHPAQLIVVASVYLIMAERHVLRHGTSWLQRSLLWRRLPHDNPSACDAALTPPAMAVEPAPTHPFRRLNCHKYITLIVARVRRWQPALVCQALLHRRFLLSVTDRQYAGLLTVPIIPAKRYHTILLRRDFDRRILCCCAST
jgi:hypothetical protein